jgi:hypothetical protein
MVKKRKVTTMDKAHGLFDPVVHKLHHGHETFIGYFCMKDFNLADTEIFT